MILRRMVLLSGGITFKKRDFATYEGRKSIEKNMEKITGENFSISYNFTIESDKVYVVYTVAEVI